MSTAVAKMLLMANRWDIKNILIKFRENPHRLLVESHVAPEVEYSTAVIRFI